MATIAIAGASGFIGRHLMASLQQRHQLIALGRTVHADAGNVSWRKTDLFSMGSTENGLVGAEIAVYLVHSMLPSSTLFQGSFYDTDLLLADNFARACVANQVRHIIYLGGLVPEGRSSAHLLSRLEVEGVLQATGIPVTVLRAGMIVGPGGSSFEMLRTLVDRLPTMILPKWAQRSTQAIFIDDIVRVLAAAVDDPKLCGRTLDVVNGEALTYEQLLAQTAQALGKARRMIRVPIASTAFSKRWVQLFGQAPYELVSPLIDSLQCDLPRGAPDEGIAALIQCRSFGAMVAETLARAGARGPASETPTGAPRRPSGKRTVRSIQRLPAVAAQSAPQLAATYLRWLPTLLPVLLPVRVVEEGRTVEIRLPLLPWPLLRLEAIAADSDDARQKLHIVGGLLARSRSSGWLEFRQVQERTYTLAAIHEFEPSLPWFLYRISQAQAHELVMRAFARFLARRPTAGGDS